VDGAPGFPIARLAGEWGQSIAQRFPRHDAGVHVGGTLLAFLRVIRESCAFGLREALRGPSGLKADDGLVVIDGNNDCVNCGACRIGSRCYFNVE
jgi:hypothetical protein